jgi:hypothetical protein
MKIELNVVLVIIAVAIGSGFAVIWNSPKLLEYYIAAMYARREALRSFHLVKKWHLKRFETQE